MRVQREIWVLFFIGFAIVASQEKCHFKKADECGQSLQDFRNANGNKFPASDDKVEELCNALEDTNKCFESYSKDCMTPLQNEMVDFFTEGSVKVYNDFCTSGSQIRSDYMNHVSCINEALDSEEAKSFTSYTEAGLEDLLQKKPNERLSTACCAYQWLISRTVNMGTEKCGKEAVDTFMKVSEMAISSLPSILCDGFDPESELCSSLLPPPGTAPKGTIRNSKVGEMISDLYFPH